MREPQSSPSALPTTVMKKIRHSCEGEQNQETELQTGVLRHRSQPLASPLPRPAPWHFGLGQAEGQAEGHARRPGAREVCLPHSVWESVAGRAAPTPLPTVLRPARRWAGRWAARLRGSAPVAPEQVPCDDQPLDLAGAFVDLGDAGVTVVPLGRHLRHVAHATQDLNGLR